jgi:hypothetical protein
MHPLVFFMPALGVLCAGDALGYVRTGTWGGVFLRRGVQRSILVVAVVAVLLWITRFFGAFGGPVPV